MTHYCEDCGEANANIEHDGDLICRECYNHLPPNDEPDFDEPEIDLDACDRESAAIHDFSLQERY
jgi:hypothetical protein